MTWGVRGLPIPPTRIAIVTIVAPVIVVVAIASSVLHDDSPLCGKSRSFMGTPSLRRREEPHPLLLAATHLLADVDSEAASCFCPTQGMEEVWASEMGL